jgi:ABC-type lipoprotein release transport system permease subunit
MRAFARPGVPLRLLVRGQFRARRRRHVLLAATVAAAFACFFAVGMLLGGAEQAVVRPAHDLLSGDVRLTRGDDALAGAEAWPDADPQLAAVRAIPGAVAAPRWEASHVTARRDAIENWTGGLLIGIDASVAEEREAVGAYLVWGSPMPAGSLSEPGTGHVYVPLVVGEGAALRLGVAPGPGGGPDFTHVLRITSGRFAAGRDAPPLDAEAVVVGVFRTGLEPMDRFTAFAPIGDVRFLVGGHPGDPSANAIVVHGASAAQVAAVAGAGVVVQDAAAFARGYLGLTLAALEAAVVLGIALFVLLLALLLARESGGQVARDAPAVAALRAIGMPAREIAWSYAALATSTVAAGLAVAAAFALAAAAWLPAVPIHVGELALRVPWRLDLATVGLAFAAAVALAAISSLSASRALARATVADALRPT